MPPRLTQQPISSSEGLRLALATAALLLPAGLCPAEVAERYTVTALHDPGVASLAHGINDAGSVVGQLDHDDTGTRAFVWTSEDGLQVLGTLGGSYSVAYDINNTGEVVGEAETATGSVHAFLWTPEAVMIDLGTLGGPRSSARAINDAGRIVGWAQTGDVCRAADCGTLEDVQEQRAFLFSGGAMQDLGTLGGPRSAATGIAEDGVIVGWSETGELGVDAAFDEPVLLRSAFFLGESGLQDLGRFLGEQRTEPHAVNEAGMIVGRVASAEDGVLFGPAFVRSGTTVTPLLLADGDFAIAYAISDDGTVVGGSDTQPLFESTSGMHRAFAWRSGVLVDLNTRIAVEAGWTLDSARAINASGWIAGVAQQSGQPSQAVLLRPAATVDGDEPGGGGDSGDTDDPADGGDDDAASDGEDGDGSDGDADATAAGPCFLPAMAALGLAYAMAAGWNRKRHNARA